MPPSVHGLPPLSAAHAHTLVLGTMPGKASLRAQEYYAHSRNLFWPLVEQLVGIPRTLPYHERVTRLTAAGIAVWDVLALCTRESSLDSDIVDPVPNDFAAFLAAHPRIVRICFNGTAAARLFDQHVRPQLADPARALAYVPLPSTSPANASIPHATKLDAWRVLARA